MNDRQDDVVRKYLEDWQLVRDGQEFSTLTSRLVPVRHGQLPAMLKVTAVEEEVRGGGLMVWWQGEGAARVYRREGPALLLERATGERSLRHLATGGQDDEASRFLCRVANVLHSADPLDAPASLVPLAEWFAPLAPAAAEHGGLLALSHRIARELLATQEDVRALHGDLHHDNVLDFGARGWLAIDPKGLKGERTFDFVNLLRNPDPAMAVGPERFARQATVIAGAGKLSRQRLLQWTLAFTGLSAAWILADGDEPQLDLAVARLAAQELGLSAQQA